MKQRWLPEFGLCECMNGECQLTRWRAVGHANLMFSLRLLMGYVEADIKHVSLALIGKSDLYIGRALSKVTLGRACP